MIKNLTITNYVGDELTIDLRDPYKSGLAITNIDGLGPVEGTVNTTELTSFDGTIFNSARLSQRNIVIDFKLLPNPTIEETRQLLYQMFPVKKLSRIQVDTDTRHVYSYGYVEKTNPIIFSSSTTAQVSVICPDPYWYLATDNGREGTKFSGVEPNFEFIFSNESLTSPLLEFSRIERKEVKNVYYSGESTVGVTITIHATSYVGNISIFNVDTHEAMYIDVDKIEALTGTKFHALDDIVICTVHGNKSARLLRDGVYTNILNCINKDADWFQLSKGDNLFGYRAESGDLNIEFTMEHDVIYEGV